MATGDDETDLDPTVLALAEAALAALHDDYLDWVTADLGRLHAALATVRGAGAEQWRKAADALFAVAHDIKGQAATFGYPLLTRMGGELCRLAREERDDGGRIVARMEWLAMAMTQVVADRLDGDGGARGRDLLRRLDDGPGEAE